MRIADNSMGTGIAIEREEDDSQELNVIATRIMPEWLALFQRKNRDYGSGSAYELGVRGQYSDIHRKMIKLKRAMWDGHDLDFEDTDEIIKDLISHLFLTLHMFGLQKEAEEVYVYNEDDTAVDAFFRMVGGDVENALKMSGVLQEPFKTLVRERAHKMLEAQQQEAMAVRIKRGEDARVAMWIDEHESAPRDGYMTADDRWDRTEDRTRNGAREARRRAREADGAPGEATVRAMRQAGAYGFADPAFADADAAQHGVGETKEQTYKRHGVPSFDPTQTFKLEFNGTVDPDSLRNIRRIAVPVSISKEEAEDAYDDETPGDGCDESEAKQAPMRIVTETVDGVTRYYHQPYEGADREPLALVPKALLERAQKDHYVLSKEQEAGLRTLADWANRS